MTLRPKIIAMGDHEVKIIRSTADLTPDGILGYAKALSGLVALLGTVLAAVQPSLPQDSQWARWVGLGIAVCGAFGVWALKNDVKPETVVVPSDPLLGVVSPPDDPAPGLKES